VTKRYVKKLDLCDIDPKICCSPARKAKVNNDTPIRFQIKKRERDREKKKLGERKHT